MTYDFCDKANFIPIKYKGPVGKHVVFSPGRYIRNYGMRTNGDTFCVHFADAEAAPALFVRIEPEPEPEPEFIESVVFGEGEATTEGALDPAPEEVVAAPRSRGRQRKQEKQQSEVEEVDDESEV